MVQDSAGRNTICPKTLPEERTPVTYALGHLGELLTLEDWAREAAMSVRTLSRRFLQETGATPMRWPAEQRLQHARLLPERTDEPVDRIAAAAGFGTGTAMRQHFREALGVSPRTYRNTFRGTN
ncbi:helix-turn-helix domain-containing protein [Streptomyces sp. NPDC087851]|uniref:helix-turn-helix domain-containing protein n=1 Tax=Streptomyces sp. NPDC087851 TaxID=3365810 RepID=UPI0037FF5455